MLHPSQTRWLYLEAVVKRLLEQWEALKLFSIDTSLDEELVQEENILESLTDPFVKLYFLLLKWVLPKFTELNKYLQLSKVTDLHSKMLELLEDLIDS